MVGVKQMVQVCLKGFKVIVLVFGCWHGNEEHTAALF